MIFNRVINDKHKIHFAIIEMLHHICKWCNNDDVIYVLIVSEWLSIEKVPENNFNFKEILFRIGKFHQHPEFWNEINKVTSALRIDSDLDPERQFLSKMFKHISPEIQHKLLLITADHCEDTMEHCKLLLLLLQKFHSAIPSHAVWKWDVTKVLLCNVYFIFSPL